MQNRAVQPRKRAPPFGSLRLGFVHVAVHLAPHSRRCGNDD